MAGRLPNLLSASRLAAAPALVAVAASGSRRWFLTVLGFALATDALDGPLARALGAVSKAGAALDSWGDFAVYTLAPVGVVLLWPTLAGEEATWVAAVVLGFLVPVSVGFLKFGRLTSYHTWAAKAAGVALGAAALPLLLDGPRWPFHLAAVLVPLAGLEEISITALLPVWSVDVPTVVHAVRLRRAGRGSG